MKKILFIVLFLLSAWQLRAQRNFKPGYIITNSTDTVNCSIQYNAGKTAFSRCKVNLTGDSTVIYEPSDIQSYSIVDERYFQTKPITIDGVKENRFLEVLFKGAVNVYFYRNREGNEQYYIQKENTPLYELKNTKRLIYKDNKTYEVEQNEYMGILKIIFEDDPASLKRVQYTQLNNKSLVNIAERYHKNMVGEEDGIGHRKVFTESNLYAGPVAGISRISNTNTFFSSETFHTVQTSATYGLFAQINFPYLMKALGLPKSFQDQIYLGYETVLYSNAGNAQVVYYDEAPEVTFTVVSTFDFSYETMNHYIYLRYQFEQWKIKPYVQCGYYIQHLRENDMNVEQVFYYPDGTPYQRNQFSPLPMEDDYTGIMGGLGVMFPLYKFHLNVNFKMKPPVDLSHDIDEQFMMLDFSLSLF